jgi:hypothetical protein
VKPHCPDADEGPRRFIRNWLTFNENRAVRAGMSRKFLVIAASLMAASALLAVTSSLLHR